MDLNIQVLQEGVESFIKDLRQLPKDVRALPVAFFLEGHMKEFKESLPLLLDLKNEALRDRSVCHMLDSNKGLHVSIKMLNIDFCYIWDRRHWKELMERTATSFEIKPDSFTLENMFAMELHKYANVIGDIVTSAVKELSIEKASIHLYELFQTGRETSLSYC